MSAYAPTVGGVSAPHKVTTSPIVTGTSVLAIKYKDGVMLTADTLGSYGSLARYTDLRRIRPVGDYTLVAAGGEYSDFQYIMDVLDNKVLDDHVLADNAPLTAPEIHSYLTRVMYQRRNKMNPLYNNIVVAGFHNGKATLGYIDPLGTAFEDNFVCSGFGMHLALPLIRKKWSANMDEAAARTLLEECMRVLWYRDTRALNNIQIAKVTSAGPVVSEPYNLREIEKWDYKSFVKPKAESNTGGSW